MLDNRGALFPRSFRGLCFAFLEKKKRIHVSSPNQDHGTPLAYESCKNI